MARNNFWKDVVDGAMNAQQFMANSAKMDFDAKERERKEKEWEQQDAVDQALANAPKEVTVKADKYKIGDQEFTSLEEASKTAALLNENEPGSAVISPANAEGKAVSGWREATQSDKYKSAAKDLQGRGYGLAADKVHAEYGKAITSELKDAIGRAAATGDWSSVIDTYNKKVGDGYEGRMEKLPDGKLAFYSKDQNGKEFLSQKFDDNAQAAAYYQSVADNHALDYWKTAVVNREAAAQKLALQQQRIDEARRHNQTIEAIRQNGGGGSRSSGNESGSKANSGDDAIHRWKPNEALEYLKSAVPDDGFVDPVTKKAVSKPAAIEQTNTFLSRMRQFNPNVSDEELASVALDTVRRGGGIESGGKVAYKLDGKGNFVPTMRYESDTGVREYAVDSPISVQNIGSAKTTLAKPDAETMKLAERQHVFSTLDQLTRLQEAMKDPAKAELIKKEKGWKFVENLPGEIAKYKQIAANYSLNDSEEKRNLARAPKPLSSSQAPQRSESQRSATTNTTPYKINEPQKSPDYAGAVKSVAGKVGDIIGADKDAFVKNALVQLDNGRLQQGDAIALLGKIKADKRIEAMLTDDQLWAIKMTAGRG